MRLPEFNKEELSFLSNADLMVKKRIIQDKIFSLLDLTKDEIGEIVDKSWSDLFYTAKISRGENYLSLPYLILDYPATFKKYNIMACRTMFLWGEFFSATIHLQGKFLEANREILSEILKEIDLTNVYISRGKTPWQYHYKPDNYLPVNTESLDRLSSQDFIKVSKRIDLVEYQSVPVIAKNFYSPFLTKLKITS